METTKGADALPPQLDEALRSLVRSVATLVPLADLGLPVGLSPGPLPVPAAGCLSPEALLELAFRAAGLQPSDVAADATGVPCAVAAMLRGHLVRPELGLARMQDAASVDRRVAEAFVDTPLGWRSHDVTAPDGTVLRTYAAGPVGAPAVVLASACGMPAALSQWWIRRLSRHHRVVTWETRALFPPLAAEALSDLRGYGVREQVGDLAAVMAGHGLDDVHVMGLCGGAVLAVEAAAEHPARISSLSLWHGDFELGPRCPKSEHQRNLKALLDLGSAGREDAAAINSALQATAMAVVAPEVAHVVAYPYLTSELFYRYCRLTGAIMGHDVGPVLHRVQQPTLVVTSEDDRTAHPAGSHAVAAQLAAATLHVEAHGDHLSVFAAQTPVGDRLSTFLETVGASA